MTAINHHTVVHSVNARRGESGNYLLRLTNDSGSDEGTSRTGANVPHAPEVDVESPRSAPTPRFKFAEPLRL